MQGTFYFFTHHKLLAIQIQAYKNHLAVAHLHQTIHRQQDPFAFYIQLIHAIVLLQIAVGGTGSYQHEQGKRYPEISI